MESKKKARMMTERTDLPVADRSVSMSNALTRGAQCLSLTEKRVLAMALAKTDSIPAKDLILSQRNGWSVRFTAQEYAETYEVDITTAYEQLKHSARALLDRKWRTATDSNKRGSIIREGNWVQVIEYCEGAGYVEIAFTPQVAPHLLALRTQFTTYKLKQAAALRSIYAWRLFECLQSWKSKGVWSPDLAEFQDAMDAPVSCRADFGRLRARVLEPALKELRQKDHLVIECEPKKYGRKVIGLVFKFEQDPQGKLAL